MGRPPRAAHCLTPEAKSPPRSEESLGSCSVNSNAEKAVQDRRPRRRLARNGLAAVVCSVAVWAAHHWAPLTVEHPLFRSLTGHPSLSVLALEPSEAPALNTAVRVRGHQVRAVARLHRLAVQDAEAAEVLAARLWVHGATEDVRDAGLNAILDAALPRFPEGYRRAFLAEILPAVLPAARKWQVPPSVTLGQAILESGWGRCYLSARYHNLFGVKAGTHLRRVELDSHEYLEGRLQPSRQTFRVYQSKGEGIHHHARLLGSDRRYAHARALWTDGGAFIDAIASRYASSPTYAATVKKIIASNSLDRWDALVAAGAAADAGEDPAAWLGTATDSTLDGIADGS